jgi:probable HAF family extracellular repeat protein
MRFTGAMLVSVALGNATPAGAQATITALLPGPQREQAYANAVNADGSTVVGYVNGQIEPRTVAARWTSESPTLVGVPAGNLFSIATSVSGDGNTLAVFGQSNGGGDRTAFRWQSSNGFTPLGTLNNLFWTFPMAVSDDGQSLFGYSTTNTDFPSRAWRWNGAYQDLGTLPGEQSARAFDATPDGQVVVGESEFTMKTAFRLALGQQMQSLGYLPGATQSTAVAVSADGATVVGTSSGSSFGTRAFLWTSFGMVELGQGSAVDVDGAGAVVVGTNGQLGSWLWTAETGTSDLYEYLVTLGCDMAPWSALQVTAISRDASTIVGNGKFTGQDRGFVVRPMIYGITTEQLAPISQVMNLGRITAGNLASLADDDQNPQVMCRFIVPFLGSPIVSTDLGFRTSKTTPTAIELRVKFKFNTAGSYTLETYQYSYPNAAHVQSSGPTPITGSFATVRAFAPGAKAQYVQAGTGDTRARITIRQTGPSASLTPCFAFEYVNQAVSGR